MKYNSCRTFDFRPVIFHQIWYSFVPKQTCKTIQLISFSLHYIHLFLLSNMCKDLFITNIRQFDIVFVLGGVFTCQFMSVSAPTLNNNELSFPEYTTVP